MKEKCLLILMVLLPCSQAVLALESAPATPSVVRVGVDVRLGLQSCMDTWMPVMEYLSKAIPDHRFVVVPLASQQDVVRTLEKGDVDFVALDPAMELLANDRYDTTPLVTIAETGPGETRSRVFSAACSGTIIRRADRSDIRGIQDIRGKRIAAVKPWSLTGWIAQWGLLEEDGVDPQTDVNQVVFVGTHEQVVKNVLDGEADVGTVSSDMLLHLIRCKKVSAESLCFINRKGLAAPLVLGKSIASTDVYPGRVMSMTVSTSEDLAQRVAEALMKQSVSITVDQIPYQVRFRIACNYSTVRHLLQRLMGPHYAESSGFPLPIQYPAWLLSATVTGSGLVAFAIAFLILRHRYVRRQDMLEEQLQATRYELAQVRAERQRINAILAIAGCGIDIIDEQNRIVYADPGLERKYGDWRGQKCHGFFCSSDTPCPGCKVPGPMGEQIQTLLNIDGPPGMCSDDPHAKVHYIEGESTQMLGIPFRDEGGRWLYARIHFPLAAFSGRDGMPQRAVVMDGV